MTAEEKRDEKHRLRQRWLDLKSELAEAKMVYLTTGQAASHGWRATCEAEMAKIEAAIYRLDMDLKLAAKVHRDTRQELFVKALLDLVHGAGLGRLIEEAGAEADRAVAADPGASS